MTDSSGVPHEKKRNMMEYSSIVPQNSDVTEAVQQFFNLSEVLMLIQGPRWTGESYANAVIGTMSVLLGRDVIARAPSGTATNFLRRKFQCEQELLEQFKPDLAKSYFLIYYPRLSQIKQELKTRHDGVISKDSMWGHIVRLMQSDSAVTSDCTHEDRTHAAEWLIIWNCIQEDDIDSVAPYQMNMYLNVESSIKRILRRRSKPFILLSTCNNAAMIKKWMTDDNSWRPDLLIVDEASSGLEADCMIPLTMWPQKVVLSGDYKRSP